ncbi:MAG: ribbon-helix-helix protein, CopG family [Gemmatimonadales bacterium]|nr:ribbon-helix-helix protein, CopG family [Gemmatimonadales bacterium]MYC89537.1 ribbon-helix-helix protein, CopG family [Candidatus Palauibacter denitrificans]
MATTTIKSTYSLDVASVRTLEALARRWKVSKSEVLRRAIKAAADEDATREDGPLAALDRLQTAVRERSLDLAAWEREVGEERRAQRAGITAGEG